MAGMTVGPELRRNTGDHHDDERNRQQQRELPRHPTDARIVSVRSEMDRNSFTAGWDRGWSNRQHCLDPVHGLDDVGPGLTLDRQDDRLLFVVPAVISSFSPALMTWPISRT